MTMWTKGDVQGIDSGGWVGNHHNTEAIDAVVDSNHYHVIYYSHHTFRMPGDMEGLVRRRANHLIFMARNRGQAVYSFRLHSEKIKFRNVFVPTGVQASSSVELVWPIRSGGESTGIVMVAGLLDETFAIEARMSMEMVA